MGGILLVFFLSGKFQNTTSDALHCLGLAQLPRSTEGDFPSNQRE